MALLRGELTRQFREREALADFVVEADAIAAPGEAGERIFARLSEQKRAREVDEELHGAKSGSKSSHIDRTAEASKSDEKGAARRREEQAYIDLIAAMSAEELGNLLDDKIDETSRTIEAVQRMIEERQREAEAVGTLALLYQNGELDPLNPEQNELYLRTRLPGITGAQTYAEFVNDVSDVAKEKAFEQAGAEIRDEISLLVDRHEALLTRMHELSEARREASQIGRLDDNDPEKARRLQELQESLDGLSPAGDDPLSLEAIRAELISSSRAQDFQWEEEARRFGQQVIDGSITPEQQVEYLRQAEERELPDRRLQLIRNVMSPEAKSLMESSDGAVGEVGVPAPGAP